jgi:hypothetical protein
VRLAFEASAVLGVGDFDQRARTLPQALAVEVGDPVLGDDVVDVRARGDDARTRFEE